MTKSILIVALLGLSLVCATSASRRMTNNGYGRYGGNDDYRGDSSSHGCELAPCVTVFTTKTKYTTSTTCVTMTEFVTETSYALETDYLT